MPGRNLKLVFNPHGGIQLQGTVRTQYVVECIQLGAYGHAFVHREPELGVTVKS